ncbi:MAG: hypothetical protein LAO05_03320 [Acidobacteriia bacterium]|nr:hypothetical protein [Terriglobia bacterium]
MKLVSRVVCLVALIFLVTNAPARAAGWQALGKCVVDYRTNPQDIAAKGGAGPVSRIKLEVDENNLVIGTVKVTFADGQTFDRDLNKYIGAGGSQVIDLPSAKEVQKVEFTYRKASAVSNSLALVRLFGSV